MKINDSAKTIVCYGDSNTRGSIPGEGRYLRSVRWTGVLQNLLGENYEIIEEGLGGRTLVANDPENPHRTGITHLKSILMTHRPIDLVIIVLGTNDIKNKFNLSVKDIANHLEQTIKLIQGEGIHKILVVCPQQIAEREDGVIDEKYIGGSEKMAKFPELFKKVADKYGCNFLNTQEYITSSKIDGQHLSPEMHKKLAEILSKEVKKMI